MKWQEVTVPLFLNSDLNGNESLQQLQAKGSKRGKGRTDEGMVFHVLLMLWDQ